MEGRWLWPKFRGAFSSPGTHLSSPPVTMPFRSRVGFSDQTRNITQMHSDRESCLPEGRLKGQSAEKEGNKAK